MLSAAIRDLYLAHGDKYEINVDTSCGQIWENNPYLTLFNYERLNDNLVVSNDGSEIREIHCKYPLIHRSNTSPYHFIHGFRIFLEDTLEEKIPATDFCGDIHISELEKSWMSAAEEIGIKDDFWIIMAGGKYDFTCVAKGSRVQTNNGYKKIEQVTSDDLVLTEWGYRKCSGSVYRGKKKCLKFTTKLGNITVTPDHRFKVMGKDGDILWNEAKNIKVSDYILCKRGSESYLISNYDNADKWFAIGRLWGDGFLRKSRTSNSEDGCSWVFSEKDKDAKHRVQTWLDFIGQNYHIEEIKPAGKQMQISYRIHSTNPFSKEEIPSYLGKGKWRSNGFRDAYFNLNTECLHALIQGLFSSDGTIGKARKCKKIARISYTTIYKQFATDIRRILWQCGITSTISRKTFVSKWGKECVFYLVSLIGSKSRDKFNFICFGKRYKVNRIKEQQKHIPKYRSDKYHGIPYSSSTINRLQTITNISSKYPNRTASSLRCDLRNTLAIRDSVVDEVIDRFELDDDTICKYRSNDWYFDQVISIENSENIETYDIVNSESESFVVEGFVSHNCKWWNQDNYQKVVDHFKGKITFIQCGSKEHCHPKLRNVVDMIGKTDLRQFIRLIYHSIGIVCPVTFAMHAAAAVPIKEGRKRPKNRACVVVAGGREPVQWEAYPHHRFLSTNGCLPCCDNGGCWKSRCQKVNDGDEKDQDDKLCIYPVSIEGKEITSIPKCMDMIKAEDVIRAIEMYYEGGALQYGSSINTVAKEK